MDSIFASFQAKKEKILSDLSRPDEEYSDLSPKGSVDLNIRPLIRDINDLPGLVTTSSCAGRISVFLEGGWLPKSEVNYAGLDPPRQSTEGSGIKGGDDGEREQGKRNQDQFAPTGGKGSGKWLFVSHDPVVMNEDEKGVGENGKTAHEAFGLTPGDGSTDPKNTGQLRLVRFHFEPMV